MILDYHLNPVLHHTISQKKMELFAFGAEFHPIIYKSSYDDLRKIHIMMRIHTYAQEFEVDNPDFQVPGYHKSIKYSMNSIIIRNASCTDTARSFVEEVPVLEMLLEKKYLEVKCLHKILKCGELETRTQTLMLDFAYKLDNIIAKYEGATT